MAYQDDFRNKVLAALKAKNLAVDISQEATQQAIVEEAQNLAKSEAKTMSAAEMKQVLEDVAKELSSENNQVTAQSADFVMFKDQIAGGGPSGPGGSYSGGGIALSTANKDIMIIPAAGFLGAAGSATSVNSLSQIDFKHIANPNAYNAFDPNEIKASLFNWAERISGNTFDTPVLGIGGAWGGVSYAPTSGWGVGTSTGSGVGGSINTDRGFGQIIFFKPATSTIYASLFNDIGLDTSYSNRTITITNYQPAVPGLFPTAGFAVTFGGIGNSGGLIIAGAGNSAQVNTIRFLSPLTISNSTVTDTLTLGLSSINSTVQNLVGGGVAQYNLSTTTTSFAAGQIFYASSTGHTHLVPLNKGSNNSYLSVNGSGNYEWTTTISASTANVAAASGSTVLYPIMNNSTQSGVALSYDGDFSVDPGANILRYSTGSFYVGTAVSSPIFTAATDISIRPSADSTTAIQLDNAAGTPVINVNTTNSRVGINNVTAPGYALDVSGDTNVSGVYRIGNASVLSNNTLGTGVVTSSLTALGIVTTGTWSATAITAFYGGTGQVTYTIGDILYANTSSTLAKLAAVAAGQFLVSNGTGVAPQYVAGAAVSVGFATTSANLYIAADTQPLDNYIIFASKVSSGTAGVGLSISNQTGQLTYNPSTQQLKVAHITGTAFTATQLTGTLMTASQPNVTSATALATVGTIGTGIWQGSAVGTTYGGTGSNLGGAIGNSNKVVITGTIANGYAATLIDGANTGYLLAANGNGTAPSFVNSTNAAFSFASGTLTINNAAITTGTITGTPTSANDIVNKSYADSISGGLDVHGSARLTTISSIGGSYRQSGTAGTLSGLGDYIIATAPNTLIGADAGWDTVGIALTNGQRVLIKDGVNGGYASGSGAYGAFPTTYGGFAASWVANGIYEVRSYGGSATSGWLLVRATDTDNQAGIQELTGGTFLFIEEGSNYADHAFVCSNDTTSQGPIGFGSTQVSWTLFAGGNTLIAGQGLVESGNNLALLTNLVQATAINANLSRGFTLGGARAASLGSSTYASFTVTGANAALSTNTYQANGDGWQLAGGETSRTLTVTGSNITLTGGGNTLTLSGNNITLAGNNNTFTLSSSSTLSLNSQTLAMTASMGNITFAGNLNPTNTTQTLVQSGQTQYILSSQTNTWAAGDMYYLSGTAHTALTRLALASGTGASVLIRSTSAPVWGTINLASTDFVSGILPVTNGGLGANSFTSNGILYGNGSGTIQVTGAAASSVLVTNGSNLPSLSTDIPTAVTIGSAYIYRVGGTDVALADGGTNNSVSGTAVSYQFAQYNAAGTAISSFALPTANNSVLIAATPTSASWSNGPLGIAYGGSNATASNFATNGVVIYDGTRLTSGAAVGLTMTGGTGLSVVGTIQATGNIVASGFNIGGNSVVTSVTPQGGSAIYGGVTINVTNTNSAGALSISGASQTITINGPGFGITGTGAATQVPYYNATRELTGSAGLVYSPTAATGIGLSINVNSTTGTILRVNSAQTFTSGLLLDVDNNGTQAFTVDFKGMVTHTVGSGNTGLIVSGGRTILSAPTSNYASINLAASSGVNPGTGNSFIGDLWYNGTNLYFKTGATTQFDLLVGSVSGSGIADRLAKWSSGSGLTHSNIIESVAGVGMTITSSAAVGAGNGATAYLTIKSLSGDEVAVIKNNSYFVRGIDSNNNRLFSVDVAGNLRATTKSFDIPHPTKEGLRLVYGVLEGPEHGVYHRGTVEGKGVIQINLPDYWYKLVGDQYTIQLTPWGNYNVCIDSKTENYFTIQLVGDFISRKFKNIKVDYIIHGSRLDAPLETEQ